MKAKTSSEQYMTECQFDVRDMPARLENGILTLEMPVVMLRDRLINERAMEDLEAAGLTTREIETEADEFMERVQARTLGKMLQKRRI